MRFVATLVLLVTFALLRPLAAMAEGAPTCAVVAEVTATMDMPCHEMMGAMHPAPDKPAPAKTAHAACASACCASPAVMPAAASEPVMVRQPVLLVAAASPAATPVPHTPDLRPPIA